MQMKCLVCILHVCERSISVHFHVITFDFYLKLRFPSSLRLIYISFHTELSLLHHLLASSCDEMVTGNAALCLAHCLELEGTASTLLGTDIVPLLLRHAAGDAKRTAVRQNAAIALGKLCRSEPRCPLTSLYKPHAAGYVQEMSLKELTEMKCLTGMRYCDVTAPVTH